MLKKGDFLSGLMLIAVLAFSVSAANKNEFPYGGEQYCSLVGVSKANGEYFPWFCVSDLDCLGCEPLSHGSFSGDFTKCDSNSASLDEHYPSCMKCERFRQARGMGYGQGKCELACGASKECDEYAIGSQGKCRQGMVCNENCNCDAFFTVKDNDFDGVPDFDDKCPGTPLFIAVTRNGCEYKSEDSVIEFEDKNIIPPVKTLTITSGIPESWIRTKLNFKFKTPLMIKPAGLKQFNDFLNKADYFEIKNREDTADNLIKISVIDSNGRMARIIVKDPYFSRDSFKSLGNYFSLTFLPENIVPDQPYSLVVESVSKKNGQSKEVFRSEFTFVSADFELADFCQKMEGKEDSKFKIYFISESYKSKEDFLSDAKLFVKGMSSFEPFKSNMGRFQFFYSYVDLNAGQLNKLVPELETRCGHDYTIVLSGDMNYAGSSRANFLTKRAYISLAQAYSLAKEKNGKTDFSFMVIGVHEFAHLFGLDDEYEGGIPSDLIYRTLEQGAGYSVEQIRQMTGKQIMDNLRKYMADLTPNCAYSEENAREEWQDLKGVDGGSDYEVGFYPGCLIDGEFKPTQRSLMLGSKGNMIDTEENFLSNRFGAVNERCLMKVLAEGGLCSVKDGDALNKYTEMVREKKYALD